MNSAEERREDLPTLPVRANEHTVTGLYQLTAGSGDLPLLYIYIYIRLRRNIKASVLLKRTLVQYVNIMCLSYKLTTE
jgi:hypothetical protein